LGAVLASALLACQREEPHPGATPARAAPSNVATSKAVPSASAPAALPSPEAPAARVARAWSDALDRHDLAALERLYGASVLFYGQRRSKAAVVAAKRAAFEKQPSFHQELIGDIALEPAGEERVTATFTKRSGDSAAFSVDTATLVLAPAGGSYVIVEEADMASLQRQASRGSSCEAKASEVVNALPEVQRATADAIKDAEGSDGGASFGGVGPNDDGDGGLTFALGVHTDERFETRVVASVARNGALTVSILGSEVPVPPRALRAVREACRH